MSEPTDEPQTILIVETDVLVRHPLAQYLRECGYKVVEALDTEEAQTLITKSDKQIEIVLADAHGLKDAFELSTWIHTNHPDIEVILAGTVAKAVEKAGDLCEEGPATSKPYEHKFVMDRILRLFAARQRNAE
jgi:DNA-binding NtrC family response regulator